MLDAAASVAQLSARRTGQFGDPLHGAGQNSDPIAEQRTIGRIMDIALDHGGIDTHPASLHEVFAACDVHDPIMNLQDHRGAQSRPPTAHGFGVWHFLTADTSEVAIDQVGADLAFQVLVAPVSHVLQDQQAQHHLGGKPRPAAPQAFRVAFDQSLMDGMNDLIICQDDVSMWHPDFMQIFDLCCDQSIAEAALQASGGNHGASLRTEPDWRSMRGGVSLVAASHQEKI
jgi:hypothetical protein